MEDRNSAKVGDVKRNPSRRSSSKASGSAGSKEDEEKESASEDARTQGDQTHSSEAENGVCLRNAEGDGISIAAAMNNEDGRILEAMQEDSDYEVDPDDTSTVSSGSEVADSSSRQRLRRAATATTEPHQQQHPPGRTTRMKLNPDFAAKQRKFLNRVHDAISRTDEPADDSLTSDSMKLTTGGGDQVVSSDESSKNSSPIRIRFSRHSSSVSSSPEKPEKRRRDSSLARRSADDTEDQILSESGSFDSPVRKKRLTTVSGKNESISKPGTPEGADKFCWRCHKDGTVIVCKICPRVYHLRCTQLENSPKSDWVCPECTTIVYAENTETRSAAMKSLSLDQLCNLLKYTVIRMKGYSGSEWFCRPVDQAEFPEYRNFVVRPMDLNLLEKNIKQKRYGSTEAFLADTKWILHNCVVFNTFQSKLTNIAKALVKIARQEMAEIENCPDCYLNAHTRKDSWFIEVCRRPHLLVWAKLKGFPFWPAKAMRTNNDNHVDVRFFGAHDRAWVPVMNVYLYSRVMPAAAKNKRKNNLDECIMEVEQHIKRLRDRFGAFTYAPFKSLFNPKTADEQLITMLPGYKPNANKRCGRLLGGVKGASDDKLQQSTAVKKEVSEKKKVYYPVKSKQQSTKGSADSEKDSPSLREAVEVTTTTPKTTEEETVVAENSSDLSIKPTATPVKSSAGISSADPSTSSPSSPPFSTAPIGSSLSLSATISSPRSTLKSSSSSSISSSSASEKSVKDRPDEKDSSAKVKDAAEIKKVEQKVTAPSVEVGEKKGVGSVRLPVVTYRPATKRQVEKPSDAAGSVTTTSTPDVVISTDPPAKPQTTLSIDVLAPAANKIDEGLPKKCPKIDLNDSSPRPSASLSSSLSSSPTSTKSSSLIMNKTPGSSVSTSISYNNNNISKIKDIKKIEFVNSLKEKLERLTSQAKVKDPVVDISNKNVTAASTITATTLMTSGVSISATCVNKVSICSRRSSVNSGDDNKNCDKRTIEESVSTDTKTNTTTDDIRPSSRVRISSSSSSSSSSSNSSSSSSSSSNSSSTGSSDVNKIRLGNSTCTEDECNNKTTSTEKKDRSNKKNEVKKVALVGEKKSDGSKPSNDVEVGSDALKEKQEHKEIKAGDAVSSSDTKAVEKTEGMSPDGETGKPEAKTSRTVSLSSGEQPNSKIMPESEVSVVLCDLKHMKNLIIKDERMTPPHIEEVSVPETKTAVNAIDDTNLLMDIEEVEDEIEQVAVDREVILPGDNNKCLEKFKEITVSKVVDSAKNNPSKVVVDSNECPLVIIDENSDAERSDAGTDRSSSCSDGTTLSNSKAKDSIHSRILKSVLENSPETDRTVMSNRRKGKPAKLRSRSNTSSSEDAVEELKRICEEQESSLRKSTESTTPSVEDVLDEVSGRFRRKESGNSTDPNVTITLVSDDEPRKTAKPKVIRPSVTLSRDVSLTIVEDNRTIGGGKDIPTGLDMECESDTDEPVIVSSTNNNNNNNNSIRLKPTARKTFPNSVVPWNKPDNIRNGGKTSRAKKNPAKSPPKAGGKRRRSTAAELQQNLINQHCSFQQLQQLQQQMNPITQLAQLAAGSGLGSGLDEVKISNTMSLKLQPANINNIMVNGSSPGTAPIPGIPPPPPVIPITSAMLSNTFNNNNNSGGNVNVNVARPATTQARVLPQLQPKPFSLSSTSSSIRNVTGVGPISNQIDSITQKLVEQVKDMLEGILRDLSAEGRTEATVKTLQLEIERIQWKHRQEMSEFKHNTDLIVMEMRTSLEAEKQRLVTELKIKCEAEKEAAINETKMKQWCALCKKEALFYCCWNTAYCNYPCQQAHWPQHMTSCAQSPPREQVVVSPNITPPIVVTTLSSSDASNVKTTGVKTVSTFVAPKTICLTTPSQVGLKPVTSHTPINLQPPVTNTTTSKMKCLPGLSSQPQLTFIPQVTGPMPLQPQQDVSKLMPPPLPSPHLQNLQNGGIPPPRMLMNCKQPPINMFRPPLGFSVRPPQFFITPRPPPQGYFN